ncbi:ribose-5-phosphate isomerase RpiA [Eupransor demetentiae]|uniref:Ribose-5-phosphate isomerase A n=1 Tax=Eupransor demetentiae TaxID=3109584 RepID=A0ABP0ERA6_9LACO|nr:Ribose 5-phosphate isomerase (RpiA) [Lactobacillaceae bacterium LMG 33000]
MNNDKVRAAQMALERIPEKAIVGLGSGSTATVFIELLAKKAKEEHMELTCVPTSRQTEELAASLGLRVVDIDLVDHIDVTVDGADEVDDALNGIKGGGAALLFEKIVAAHSHKNIWVVDSSKKHHQLGHFKLPVEVIKFGSRHIYKYLDRHGLKPEYRLLSDGHRLSTDSDNYIIDIDIQGIEDLDGLANQLKHLTGVVEHGLFMEICDELLVGSTGEAFERK